MQLTPGTRLGPYEIVALLGAGGMGEVYRARDTRLGRDVAVKVLPQHLSSSAEVRARFEREARTVSSLNHPNICTLYDIGREGDTDYLVMELIDGETLAARVAKGPLRTDQVLALGTQIAAALARAHRAGIVHRDLKPGNVMLTKSGAKLMDFGLARATGLDAEAVGDLTESPTVAQPLTAEGTIVGTFQYMAPEQLEGREADSRSDVWALGCVLYEMVTGKRPFEGKSQASLIAAIMEKPPRALSELSPASPPALDRLVRACLAKDPDDRIQTAHDVGLQLEWMGAESSAAARSTPAAAAPAQSHGGAGGMRRAMAAVVVVAIIAVAAGFLAGRRSAPPATSNDVQFHRKTFRKQAIFTARFMPNGKTIVLSAALEGNTTGLYVIRPEYPEPQSLGMKNVHLLAVSSRGELAVLNHARFTGHHRLFDGTLARMPLEGGAPRDILEHVREADWSPDGSELAIIHEVADGDQLEFPIGHVLYRSSGYLSDMRVSHGGDSIAFMEHPARFDDRGSVKVIDLGGRARELASGYWGMEGLAWSPADDAVYFSAAIGGSEFSVYRADIAGGARLARQSAGLLIIHDIAPDGTWIVTGDDTPTEILLRDLDNDTETNLSWLDAALYPKLSPDGRTILFTDESEAAGPNYSATLRPTSGGAIVRLGEGFGTDFSVDGRFVLSVVPSTPPRVMSYPVGAGQSVQLDRGQFENISDAYWTPDGAHVLVSGNLADQPPRCFLLDPTTREATPIGPEGIREGRPSPDGKVFAARTQSGWSVFPISGDGDGSPVPSMTVSDLLIRWSPDATAVYAFHQATVPTPVDRIDVSTGRRETIATLGGHRVGLVSVLTVSIGNDLKAMVYATWNYSSVLYTVTSKG
ncbi:MAG: protein kinase [Acidobacteriota bacterium]